MNARVVNHGTNSRFFADQAAKFGFLAAPDLLGQLWFIDVGQEVVGHKLPSTQQVYVVLEGNGRLRAFDDTAFDDAAFYQPNPTIKVDPPPQAQPRASSYHDFPVEPHSVVVIPAGTLHAIYNDGGTRMLLVSVTGSRIHDALYISR